MRARLSLSGAAMVSGLGLAAFFLLLGFKPPDFVDPEPIRAEAQLAENGGPEGLVLEEGRLRGALGLAPRFATGSASAPAMPKVKLDRTSAVPPADKAEAFRLVGCYEEAGELRCFLKGMVSGRFIPVAAAALPTVLADYAITLVEGPGFSLVSEEGP